MAANSDIIGGDGGANFRITCDPGAYIFGFDIRHGKALDQIAPICAQVKDGAFTPDITRPGWTGGHGGGVASVLCPGYHGVAGLDVYVDNHGIVRHFNMMCYVPGNGQVQVVGSPTAGGEDAYNAWAHCPPNQFAHGIVGRAGQLVDALGVQCDTPPGPPPPRVVEEIDKEDDEVKPPVNLVNAVLDVDVYDKANNGTVIGTLAAGAQVELIDCDPQDVCHVKGNAVPRGEGFVFSGPSYNSLGRQ